MVRVINIDTKARTIRVSNGKDDLEWFTTDTGAHIPLKKGQSKAEAIKEHFGDEDEKNKKETNSLKKKIQQIKKDLAAADRKLVKLKKPVEVEPGFVAKYAIRGDMTNHTGPDYFEDLDDVVNSLYSGDEEQQMLWRSTEKPGKFTKKSLRIIAKRKLEDPNTTIKFGPFTVRHPNPIDKYEWRAYYVEHPKGFGPRWCDTFEEAEEFMEKMMRENGNGAVPVDKKEFNKNLNKNIKKYWELY